MTELLNVLKNDVPALSFFCVGSAFALFFLVLSFFYIAKEKKRRNAFDVVTTVINIIELTASIIIGLCAVFYYYPISKVNVSGDYAADISVFGFSFSVPAFGAVLKFITSAYGISLSAVLLFALLLFVIVHPLRIARKEAVSEGANAFSELEETETLDGAEDKPLEDGHDEELAGESGDTLIDELSEENLSEKIDEIVTRAKIDVSASDDVSPYILDENDVSGVLEMLSDEVTGDEAESDEVTDEFENDDVESDDILGDEAEGEEFDGESDEDESIAADEEADGARESVREEIEKEPEKEERNTAHVSDYVIPVSVRTINRRKPEPEAAPVKKQEEKPAQAKKTQKPAAKKSGAKAKTENVKAEKETAATVVTPEKAKPAEEHHVETRVVEAKHIPALPVGRRYVVQNRRNVVNMFNDYLNSKDKEEKEKLANSLNTIILK